MKQFAKLLLLSVLLCCLHSTAIAQNQRRTTRKPASSPVICKTASVPGNMVVVGYKRNSACSAGYELLVKQPENGDIICADSPLPRQFSIVTEAQGASLGSCPHKAFLIQAKTTAASTVEDDPIGRAFANQTSDIQVEGEGTVSRVLPDDVDGSRHQRFLVQLASGQTLLIAHNIDIASRVNGLEEGDTVRFNGEYVWNEKGGVVHWTHHDPKGRHVSGWIEHNGKFFK
ncbi:MAG TPA: DUF3465 domain-containing protein [Pyrinomonadaceae bacterium]|nr:DUF3465 domain-containing protein [Pyrinomonadaceae bacterium]